MTSDAMIHDCGSFTVEYQYALKPAMFVSKDIEAVTYSLNKFGREAIDLHYQGSSEDEVKKFIHNVVIGGIDTKETERKAFYNRYLIPPNGKTVAENTYHEFLHIYVF